MALNVLSYGHARTLDLPFNEALERVRTALKAEGFGVLCEIDIREKLREKLGVEFTNYVILGACNPPLAHEALKTDMNIGLLLPCNVVVYEESGRTVVAAIDAAKMLSIDSFQTVAASGPARFQQGPERTS